MVVGVVGPLSTVACAISEAKLSLAVADVVILDEKSRMRNRLMVVVLFAYFPKKKQRRLHQFSKMAMNN